MTELDYVLANFDRHFRSFRGKRIALHGSREYARGIIGTFDRDYRFAGVLSFEPVEGERFCGLPVLTETELFSGAVDLLILTERVRYAEAAFQALSARCAEKGIALYDMYGLDEQELHRRALNYHVLTERSLPEWKAALGNYSLVVFEVVDTLTRISESELRIRPLFPELIAWLTDRGVQVAYSLRKSFSEELQTGAVASLHPNGSQRLIRRVGEDLSLRTLREAEPEQRILYVGSGLVYEHILPQYYGLDVWRCMEQYDSLIPVRETGAGQLPGMQAQMDRISAAIDENEVVSFDIFDTLLMRRVPAPEDVFLLSQKKLRENGLPSGHFVERRRGVQQAFPLGTLDCFYKALEPLMGWTAKETAQAEKLELETERAVLCPRASGRTLYHLAQKKKKRLVLTSDMYLPETVLRPILREHGYDGYEHVLISCEQGTDKRGDLFARLRQFYGAGCRILHIGDHPEADGLCRTQEIDYQLLPPLWQTDNADGWSRCAKRAEFPEDRFLLGLTLAHLGRTPPERDRSESLKSYGAALVGPVLLGYVTWLIARMKETKPDGLLFFARDGWLPRTLYEKWRVQDPDLPPSVYFHTSRHAAQLLCATEPEVMDDILCQSRSAGLSGEDILTGIYGLAPETVSPADGESPEACVRRHMEQIRQKEAAARKGTLRYAEASGVMRFQRLAVSDFFSSGSTQYFLQTLLPAEIRGFYAGNYKTMPRDGCLIEYYFQGINDTIFRNFMELEGVFTSPEPSVDHIQEDGTVVFSREYRGESEKNDIALIQESALGFALEYLRLFGFPEQSVDAGLVEELFAANGNHIVISRQYNDLIQREIETKPWQKPQKKQAE